MKVTIISFSFKRGIPDDPTGNGNAPAAKRSGCPNAARRELRSSRKGPRQHRSVYFAERIAERLSGSEDVEIDVSHTAKQYWTTNHAKENRDIIFQEELG